MARRQRTTSPLLIGAFNQRTSRRHATANRPGPLCAGSGRLAVCVSEGVAQYGLASARERSALALEECRSAAAAVIDSFSSAPTWSWNALIVLRILRANQKPEAKKASSNTRFPSSYQLICIQELNSLMFPPWTGTGSIYNSAQAGGTGRKSKKRAGARAVVICA